MAKQTIGLGAAPNDGTGDNARVAFGKINDNFDELYTLVNGALSIGMVEYLQDIAGALLGADGADLDWTYDDAGNALGASIKTSVLSTFGRTVTSAANAAAGRTAMGLGTAAVEAAASFAAASHTHPGSEISDATAAGLALLTAANAAAQRTALSLGSAALVAAAAFALASHTHSSADITDASAAGLALLTAANAAAQRSALSLGSAALAASGDFAAASHSHAVGDVTGLTEEIQDRVGALLGADGGDLDWTYDDAGNALGASVKTSVISTFGRTFTSAASAQAVQAIIGFTSVTNVTMNFQTNVTDFKDSVDVATTANISLTGEQTIDGVLTAASRILVKDQTSGAQNGIYITAAGAWSRDTEADASDEVTSGMIVFVELGTANAQKFFALATQGTITVGTTVQTFSEIVLPVSPEVITQQTAASYTLVATDPNKMLKMNRATAQTLTAPNQSVKIPTNSVVYVMKYGAGNVTIAAGAGVTIRAPNGLVLTMQYGIGKLKKLANNEWLFTILDGPPTESFEFALSDLSTALTTGDAKGGMIMPYAFTITEMFIGLIIAQSSSGVVTVDLNVAGSTVLGTKASIDANESTSLTGTAAAISGTTVAVAKGAILTGDIDAAGTGAKGLVMVIVGYRT